LRDHFPFATLFLQGNCQRFADNRKVEFHAFRVSRATTQHPNDQPMPSANATAMHQKKPITDGDPNMVCPP
jgi:hypothetical protein